MEKQNTGMPKVAIWLLQHVADPEDVLSLIGDVEEDYKDICSQRGKLRAKSWAWHQVLISLPPFFKSYIYWSITMIKNYLKIAFRVIKKHKGYSFINITGLAVGIACCVLILLWVQDELRFNRFHKNYKEIYRTTLNLEGRWTTSSPWALAPILKREYPEIQAATRYRDNDLLFTYEDKSFYEDTAFVDPDFFDIFTFPLGKGDQDSPFPTLDSIVITERTATKYFGSDDPLGKTLTASNRTKLTVTGIIKNIPSNSTLTFDILASVKLFGEETLNSWALESGTFILLQKNASPDALGEKIAGITMEYDKRTNKKVVTGIQPLSRIHLYSLEGRGNIIYIYIFSTIALFILLIACINFMNLSTARGSTRAKEVGLRKVVGAHRQHVINQFYGESLLLSFVSLLIAIVLVYLLLPAFNNLAQKSMQLDLGRNLPILLGLLGITLFTGIVSGSYPAMFLSSFRPANVIKGTHFTHSSKSMLRKVLVVTQFSIAIVLIIGTIVTAKQLNYIRNKELGFNRQHVISLPMNPALRESYEAFKNEALNHHSIIHVTSAQNRPTQVGNINPVYWEGKGPEQYEVIKFISCDHDYIKTFEMEMAQGRDFSRDFPTDLQNYIVNEEAVKLMGLEDPVGKLFSIWQNEGQIIGVVKNFHSRPLHNEIEPLVLTLAQNNWGPNYVFLRIGPENISRTLDDLVKTWKKFAPNYPFDFQFLDEAFEQLYRTDQRTGTIFKYFAILAIFISCLGIFGLAAFTAEQRTKEIGIRKVLGASVSGIVSLISREFVLLLTLANVIAWPIAYFLMKRMLNNYAYRTNITLWIFLTASLLAYSIALLTVSYQAFKSARTDPALALRYE
ncbi:MAG: ABC transporter permease [Candidatus Aminicenantes bacterium]|nr:MAG: ABC transporter permease [Candidatus Aminicenantes bacterium]